MKGEIILYERSELEYYEFQLTYSEYDFHVGILVDDTPNCLEQQLKNRKDFDECMKASLSQFSDDEETVKNWKYLDENFENILSNTEYIKLMLDNVDQLEFIEKNPIIHNKKIVLDEIIEITDRKKIEKIGKKYSKYLDNIYVCLDGNVKYISYYDCLKTMDEIEKRANEIKQLNLSPMETIMYTYDQVRKRVYKEEKEDEDKTKSRDLTNVLFGEEIVCVGYAKIFKAILNIIGIDCHCANIISKTEDIGHERNIIYVKDPKYKIDGVYYFDPTWDSMRKENSQNYLYSYNHFAKTRLEMEELEDRKFNYRSFDFFSGTMFFKIIEIIESKEYNELLEYADSLNYMSNIVMGKRMIDKLTVDTRFPFYGKFNKVDLLKNIKKVVPKFNKPISAEVYIKLLNNVRKVEYYKDSNWYPYSVDYLYNVYKNSNWDLADVHYSGYEELLMSIFGKSHEREKDSKRDFTNFIDNENIEKDIERVRLTKVLQKIRESKK